MKKRIGSLDEFIFENNINEALDLKPGAYNKIAINRKASVAAVYKNLEKAGFIKIDFSSSDVPDGSWSSRSEYFYNEKKGLFAEFSKSYGVTARDNRGFLQIRDASSETAAPFIAAYNKKLNNKDNAAAYIKFLDKIPKTTLGNLFKKDLTEYIKDGNLEMNEERLKVVLNMEKNATKLFDKFMKEIEKAAGEKFKTSTYQTNFGDFMQEFSIPKSKFERSEFEEIVEPVFKKYFPWSASMTPFEKVGDKKRDSIVEGRIDWDEKKVWRFRINVNSYHIVKDLNNAWR